MKKILITVLSLAAIYGCEEIVSVSYISEEMIDVLAPLDGTILYNDEVTFSWNQIDFADRYQIQIAEPTFAQASQIAVDTILVDSLQIIRSFSKELLPGSYQWRVRGLNSNYSTDYNTQSFIVDTLGGENPVDISSEIIALIAPSDNIVLDSNTVNFTWDHLPNASGYGIQIATPNFENPEQIVLDTTSVNSSYSIELTAGDFEWRIQGFNEEFNTAYSSRSFSISTAADISDQEVVLLAPSDGLVVNDTNVTFSWESLSEATSYSFQIARPDFENPEELVVNTSFDTAGNQSFTLENNTSYQWRVKAINETSETAYTRRDVSVNVTEDLSEQEAVIVTPEDGFETSDTSIMLSWEPLEQATLYRVIIIDVLDNSFFLEQTSTESTLTVAFEVGSYTWAVRGENDAENTPYTEQTITIIE